MSGYSFEKKITLGNMIQILILSVAVIGGFFGIKSAVNANTVAHMANAEAIRSMQAQTSGMDVLIFKVDMNTAALSRIEEKLDD